MFTPPRADPGLPLSGLQPVVRGRRGLWASVGQGEAEGGLPEVDHEFYVMQGEIYTEAAKKLLLIDAGLLVVLAGLSFLLPPKARPEDDGAPPVPTATRSTAVVAPLRLSGSPGPRTASTSTSGSDSTAVTSRLRVG